MKPEAPEEIAALARARSAARAAHDFAAADRLRGEIETAGWKVVDRGLEFSLAPARPADVEEGTRVRYGSSASVPSRLAEAPTAAASVVFAFSDWPDDLARAVGGLRSYSPGETQIIVAADDPSPALATALEDLGAGAPTSLEIVWTSARLGHAAALNAAIRRAAGEIVLILDGSVEPTSDIVSPLVAALADPAVAVAGGWGLVSSDLRHFEEVASGDVAAVEGYALAFRRSDYLTRGPLDEGFRFYRNLDIWWSLVLRDEGEGVPSRRALAVPLPAVRHEQRAWTHTAEAQRDRLSRRNFYRIIDRFGPRRDLAVGGA